MYKIFLYSSLFVENLKQSVILFWLFKFEKRVRR